MLGNLGGLHAGQERRSDRIALRLRESRDHPAPLDLSTAPLRLSFSAWERPSHQRVLRLTPQA